MTSYDDPPLEQTTPPIEEIARESAEIEARRVAFPDRAVPLTVGYRPG
jgi:hypothetical protein